MEKLIRGEGKINFFGKNYALVAPLIENSILENNTDALNNKLDEGINNFNMFLKNLNSVRKKDFKSQIKRKAYRNWIKACIKGGRRELILAKKNLKHIDIALLYVDFAQRLFDYHKPSSIFCQRNLQDHMIPLEKIRPGDVIVSYKTTAYIDSHSRSKWISRASSSRITHSSIISKKSGDEIKLLDCLPETNGVKERPFELLDGEIFFVLEPDISETKKKELINKMKEFIDLAELNRPEYTFSEKKCWAACFVGLLYRAGVVFGSKNLILPNPALKDKGYFCSELVDEIFRSLGIYLAPRSYYRALAGPPEFFHSPYLKYKGVVYSSTTKIDSEKELLI